MQENRKLVSVVIPAYNAASFLTETILSVKQQTYSHWELIVVNDGSTDTTRQMVEALNDDRIKLINQQNSGVSAARNNGLLHARGDYIVFLDADDLLTSSFLDIRVDFLDNNPEIGFAGGLVESFPVKTADVKAAAENPQSEILFFDSSYGTVPSNYMFRRKVLMESGVRFNLNLNSTADRFFILQISKYTRGRFIDGKNGRLLYRISDHSMSHNISPALIFDNEQFYRELLKEKMLPENNVADFKSRYFYMLAMGFAKVRNFRLSFKYFLSSFLYSPGGSLKRIAKKINLHK